MYFIIFLFFFFFISLVQRFISEDKLPHLLFYGPPGTGKTSTILACAKQLYKGKEFNSMVLEVWRITPFLLNRIGFILFTFFALDDLHLIFCSWMRLMTEVSTLSEVLFSVLPALAPSSSKTHKKNVYLRKAGGLIHVHDFFDCPFVLQERLQVSDTGWGRCYDPGCPECIASR